MTSGAVSPVFAGRENELAALREAFGATPATVLIGGEAGVGKSRLVLEFVATVADRAVVLTGTCVELGGLPYAPFIAVLRQLVRRFGAERIGALLPGGPPGELARLLPDLGPTAPDAEPDLARARLFEQLLALLERLTEAEDRPVVLVIEDAHWADPSSRALLAFLVHNQQAAPASMVAVTYRSDELDDAHALRPMLADLGRLGWVRRLELRRLRKRDVIAQARAILGREPDPGLVEETYRRSDGNPLFVEALLTHDSGELPEHLSDLLLSRARRLPEQTQQVLRVVAAGGDRVGHPLLAAVTALDEDTLTHALRPAVAANLLVVDADEYAFRHALIKEAVHADLLPGERIKLHTRYAEELAAAGGSHPAAHQELAHHWYAARDLPRALGAAWQAAVDAERSLAYAEQLRMLARVLELWDSVPEAAERIGVSRTAVMEQAVAAADQAGEHEQGEALATAALGQVDSGREPVRAAALLQRRSRMRRHLGRDGDVADLRSSVRLVPADHPAHAAFLAALSSRLMDIPLPEEARATAAKALALARQTGDVSAEAMALTNVATLDARQGDFGQLAHLGEARALAEAGGAYAALMRAVHWESSLLEAYGRYQQAAETARAGLAAATRAGLARTSGALHAANLVNALIPLGRWNEALEVIEHTLDLAPTPGLRALLLRSRGVIALARGDAESAAAAASEARDALATGRILDPNEALPLTGLEIELHLLRGSGADALAAAEQALAEYDLERSSRFGWPLVATGARAAREAQAAAAQAAAARGAALLTELGARAEKLQVATPVQQAHSLTFAAEAAVAGGGTDLGMWDAAATAWHDLAQPEREAYTLLHAAEAAVADGNRGGAAVRLRRAAELAGRLEARPLRDRIDDLARRARIVVWPHEALPTEDPVEQARRRLGLTPRELDVLRMVADGRNNREIAEQLFISAKTASVHVSNILSKLGVSTRVEAAATAHRLHLFD